MKKKIKILGSGVYLPPLKISSLELDKQKGFDEGNVESRTGVRSRHYVQDESASDLAYYAIQQALENASLSINDIDCLIAASGTMEQAIPCNAAKILARLATNAQITAFDINMTCLSALMAMDVASSLLVSGQHKRILIVSSEIASCGLDWEHIETGGLFGDGAAALIVSQTDEEQCGIRSSLFRTYSDGVDLCQIKGGGSLYPPSKITGNYTEYGLFKMQGKELYRHSRKVFAPFCEELFAKSGISIDSIDWVVLHQASGLALKHLEKTLNLNPNKIIYLLRDCGNQVAVSLPAGLHKLLTTKDVKHGDKVFMLGTSAGLSLGGMVLEL